MIREQSGRVNTHQAECRNAVLDGTAHPDWWFTKADDPTRRIAISICLRCPIREACAKEAIDAKIPYGVFGGMGARERGRRKLAA